MQLINTRYVDPDVSRDRLWSGAIQGMLTQLIQARGVRINTLLDPERVKEMKAGLEGSFSGWA